MCLVYRIVRQAPRLAAPHLQSNCCELDRLSLFGYRLARLLERFNEAEDCFLGVRKRLLARGAFRYAPGKGGNSHGIATSLFLRFKNNCASQGALLRAVLSTLPVRVLLKDTL
jgi:hypothetical protein